MINSELLEKIYQQVNTNQIDKMEGTNKLGICIFNHPEFFGLEKLYKEDLHDFVCFSLEKLKNIFGNFNPKYQTKFSTYLQMRIRFLFLVWKRSFAKTKIKDDIIIQNNLYENTYNSYEYIYSPEKEFLSKINETSPIYHPNNKINKKNMKLKDFELMIIALKSCSVITEHQINSICQQSNIDKDILTKYVDTLNNKMLKRRFNKNYVEELVYKDFLKLQELKMKIDARKKAFLNYKIIENRYNHVKRRRSKNLERLKKIKLIPSDIDIANLLDLTPGKVRYYLKKNFDIFKIEKRTRKKEYCFSNRHLNSKKVI